MLNYPVLGALLQKHENNYGSGKHLMQTFLGLTRRKGEHMEYKVGKCPRCGKPFARINWPALAHHYCPECHRAVVKPT